MTSKIASAIVGRALGLFLRLLPLLPAARRLPCRYWLYSCAGWEPELRAIQRLAGQHGIAIDVGANHGLYSYRLSALFDQVHAFEVNCEVTEELKAFNPGNIQIHEIGLSDSVGEATLHIPLVNGKTLDGWASLTSDNCPGAEKVVVKKVQVVPLDQFELSGVTFIKIDVEGHELAVLRGARKTIAKNAPGVLVEVRPGHLEDVRSYFRGLEYRSVDPVGQFGFELSPGNHFFSKCEP